MESLILTEVRNQIAYITINRPQQLNALNKDTIAALHDALKTANDDTAARVIILTGSGEKAFVAGADIKEFADFNIAQGGELAQHGQASLFDFIENLSQPQYEKLSTFFETMPKLKHEVTWKCAGCGHEDKVLLEGLSNFFA